MNIHKLNSTDDHKLIFQHEIMMSSSTTCSTPSTNSSNNITPLTSSSSCSIISYTASPDVSFNSLSSLSVRSSPLNGTTTNIKPHKANQAAWEAMKLLRGERGGRIGLESFHLLKRVGSGDIGNVYLCQLRSPDVAVDSRHCLYAMKVVDREALACRNKLQRAEMEKEILAILDHPFLPTLYAEFESSRYSCLVMEYCPGGDLHALRQRQPERRFSLSSAKFYVAEVLLAVEYLHMMGVVYRDLKPENVLVREDGHIMLSDFDLALKCDVTPKFIKSQPVPQKVNTNTSKSMPNPCALPTVMSCFSTSKQDNTTKTKTSMVSPSSNQSSQEANPEVVVEPTNARSKSFVGTHEYLAPEVIAGSGHGSAVDWWTFGVFLYELIYGRTPFRGNNNETTLINIIKQPLSFPSTANCKHPDEMARVQDLIGKLLMKNPKKRIGSVKGAVEIKRHEFFKGVNWALIRTVKPPDVPKNQAVGIKTRNMAESHMNMGSDKMDPSHFDYF